MSFNQFQIPYRTSSGEVGRFECTPGNTELYWHSEPFNMVDHVFHRHNPSDARIGAFIWRHILGDEQFTQLASAMIQSGEWVHHYRPSPTDSDFDQYSQDANPIPDEVPDDLV